MAKTMRTWQYSSIIGKLEDCLQINNTTPIPTPSSLSKGMTIVEVLSASLNPVDYKLPESSLGRFMVTPPATPGLDFCGRVIATHPSDKTYKTGQLVFGGFTSATKNGTLGQQIVVPNKFFAPVPPGVNLDDAAAVGTAATTAFQSLMPDSFKPGAHIFINGGSGGVGSSGIQLAKAMGAGQVVITCSSRNVKLCRQLGADEVIDYRKSDILSALEGRNGTFDLVIDNIGSSDELYDNRQKLLKPDGVFVQVGVGEAMSMSGIFTSGMRKVKPSVLGGPRFHFVTMKNEGEMFTRIGEWMAAGKVRAVVDSVFPWEDVPAAFRKLREGHATGKVVVHVAN